MADSPSAVLQLVEDEDGNVEVLLAYRPRLDDASWAHYFATVGLAAIQRAMQDIAAGEGGEVEVRRVLPPAGHG